jgi:hypothetical protein
MELAIDVIERAKCRLVAHRRSDRLAADDAFETHGSHQTCNRAAGDIEALALQLPPDLANAVDAEVRLEHTLDLVLQGCIPSCPSRQPGGINALGDMVVVGRRGDRQHLADRLDPMRLAVIVDERDHGLNRRSSSAWAKYALALRRISLACRSSRFSRSRALSFVATSVGTPARTPLSRSTFFTHSCSVCAVQPIFAAIDETAAQREACSPS